MYMEILNFSTNSVYLTGPRLSFIVVAIFIEFEHKLSKNIIFKYEKCRKI